MQNAKPVSTPLAAYFKLSATLSPKTDDERDYMSRVPYSSTVGSLIYSHGSADVYLQFGRNEDRIWRASGITSELQLYCTAIGALVFAALMLFAGWFHYHKAAPKLAWFQDVESMLNHHLAGLLGLGSLSWAGHQVHVSLPINQFLNAGVDPKEIPLPHEFILNRDLLAQLYPSFAEGATPFFTLNWSKYADFLTFRGGLDPVTGGLWLTDIAHHHLAIAILFLIAGHMYKTNWGIGHGLKDILEAHKGPFTGQGHKGLYEILTTSWHAQLSLNLAMLGSLTIVVAHHMYSMPPYPYLSMEAILTNGVKCVGRGIFTSKLQKEKE
ncbi:Photosystem I chlorophyll a apoprotein A1 [Capsicum baccatum]|uniref:Photosystem I chlorophyll a apoprotein A1 n=1 Tax=Capsicum baccatum TaxID=33114 RepID=A0A2G2X0B1_CAPBA|nr:Photosystem I chlorophyll a apoprotein A1 [Capsicum baccatum]